MTFIPLGGGGACRSALYAFHRWLGVNEIYIVNRDRSEVEPNCLLFTPVFDFVGDLSSAKSLPTPFFVVGAVPDCKPQSQGETTASLCTQELMGRDGKSKWFWKCATIQESERRFWVLRKTLDGLSFQGQRTCCCKTSFNKFFVWRARR